MTQRRAKVICWSCAEGKHLKCHRKAGMKYTLQGREHLLRCDCHPNHRIEVKP